MGRTLYGPPIHHPRTHIMILERPWVHFRLSQASDEQVAHSDYRNHTLLYNVP